MGQSVAAGTEQGSIVCSAVCEVFREPQLKAEQERTTQTNQENGLFYGKK